MRFCSGASAWGLLCPWWGDLVPHGGDVPPLQPSGDFAHKPTLKRFPALLLFSIWLCICWGIHYTGLLFAGRPSGSDFYRRISISCMRFLSTHHSRGNQWRAACTSSFRAHLALICIWYLGQTLGSVLFHPVLPTSVIFIRKSHGIWCVFFLVSQL